MSGRPHRTGRPHRLTAEQVAEARRRYELYDSNRPAVIAREMGVKYNTLRMYFQRKHKRPFDR